MERFMRNVSPEPMSGCWLWTGALHSPFGYGAFKWGARNSKVETAHRVSHKLFKGPVLPGLCVRHACDNPACVNPNHLDAGTFKDNSQDAVSRGRHSHGEKHFLALMTEDQARIAKTSDIPTKVLAAQFGCSRQSVADARYGRTWKHVQ